MSEIETGNYDYLSATEIEAVKEAAKEAAKSLLRSDAEKDLRDEIAANIKEEYKIKKSDFMYLAMRYHRQDKNIVTANFENKNALFDKVFEQDEAGEQEED